MYPWQLRRREEVGEGLDEGGGCSVLVLLLSPEIGHLKRPEGQQSTSATALMANQIQMSSTRQSTFNRPEFICLAASGNLGVVLK